MQEHDFVGLNQDGPFSPRELLVALGAAVLWVALSAVAVRLLLLPAQMV
ncbi:hypothetical protein [Rhodoferax saidenbachensis]|nr:hypothetical protein [Rhodoferax saidenbachensis]